MKIRYIFFGLLTLATASCTNEEYEVAQSADAVRVFAGMVNTRISFNEGEAMTNAAWEGGDVINLFTDAQNNLQYTAITPAGDGLPPSEFAANGDALQNNYNKAVYAHYPATDADNTTKIVPLPNTQTYADVKNIRPFVYAIDTIKSSQLNLHFKHVYAYLKLTFTNGILSSEDTDSKLGAISLSSDNNISVTDGEFNFSTQTINVKTGATSISVGTDGFDLSQDSLVCYIPVLPQAEGTKITIKAQHVGGNAEAFYTFEKIVPAGGMLAGHVYKLTLNNTRIPGIYNLEDLRGYAVARRNLASVARWKNDEGVINFFADIDMGGVSKWEERPAAGYGDIIEGNNHKIFNINFTGLDDAISIFGSNLGIIRNLNFYGECNFMDAHMDKDLINVSIICNINWQAGIIYNCNSYVNIYGDSVTVAAGLCTENRGKIENCSNYGNIKGALVCGIAESCYMGEIINCSNYGTIEGVSARNERGISGICNDYTFDYANPPVVSGCINEGKIIGGDCCAGGICGEARYIIVENCINRGEVNGNTSGGIIGVGRGGEIVNCHNEGFISGLPAGGICGILSGLNYENNINGGTVNGAAGTDANAIGRDERNQ